MKPMWPACGPDSRVICKIVNEISHTTFQTRAYRLQHERLVGSHVDDTVESPSDLVVLVAVSQAFTSELARLKPTGAVISPFLSSVLTLGRRSSRLVGIAIAVVVGSVVFFAAVAMFLVDTIGDQCCLSLPLSLWCQWLDLSRVRNVSSTVGDVVVGQADLSDTYA